MRTGIFPHIKVLYFWEYHSTFLQWSLNGNFSKDGAALLANPWGVVSFVDLYAGFALFSIWIGFREKRVFFAILWIILMMLGFFTGNLYVLIALYQSRGDWLTFFLGARKDIILNNSH